MKFNKSRLDSFTSFKSTRHSLVFVFPDCFFCIVYLHSYTVSIFCLFAVVVVVRTTLILKIIKNRYKLAISEIQMSILVVSEAILVLRICVTFKCFMFSSKFVS